jgi:hypothetical protein
MYAQECHEFGIMTAYIHAGPSYFCMTSTDSFQCEFFISNLVISTPGSNVLSVILKQAFLGGTALSFS